MPRDKTGPSIGLIGVDGNPVPDGLAPAEVVTRDRVRLRVATLRADNSRGTVVIAGDRGDFIERYFETVRNLVARGFSVAIFDFRDQGGSQRRSRNRLRDRVRRFSEYEEDLLAVMTGVVLPDCPPPYFALGHSVGGHVLLRALRQRSWFDKVVLSSPFLGIDPGLWPMPIVTLLARAMTVAGLGRIVIPGQRRRPWRPENFTGNRMTSDRSRFLRSAATLQAEPRLGLGGPSFRWLDAAFDSINELWRSARPDAFRTPILIVAAGRDRLADTEAARRFALATQGIVFVTIENARHDLLAERDEIREQFFAAFDSFISGRAPGSAADDSERLVEKALAGGGDDIASERSRG